MTTILRPTRVVAPKEAQLIEQEIMHGTPITEQRKQTMMRADTLFARVRDVFRSL